MSTNDHHHDEPFRQLAAPSWNDRLREARRKLDERGDRRADGRARQFNVTLADRAQLDALAEALDAPRSEVINLALSLLAEKHGQRSDFYAELCAEGCKMLFNWMHRAVGFRRQEAAQIAADVWKGWLPPRRAVYARLADGHSRQSVERDVRTRCEELCDSYEKAPWLRKAKRANDGVGNYFAYRMEHGVPAPWFG